MQYLGSRQLDKFELNHAVTLFTQQTTTINNLWTVYAAATFAAAGYGISTSALSPIVALAVTLGFVAFAIGHLSLLMQGLKISQQVKKNISSFMESAAKTHPFKSSIEQLIATANPPWISLVIHLLIDLCVVIALWDRVEGPT